MLTFSLQMVQLSDYVFVMENRITVILMGRIQYQDCRKKKIYSPSKYIKQVPTIITAREATRTTTYTAVILVGIGVTGLMIYTVCKELLSSFSPQTVYGAALEKCSAHPRVVDFLGDSIKGYGEESRRGRRQHVSHMGYEVEGCKGYRIKFHLKGQRRTATVNLDARQTAHGWDFRYLYVQLDSYPYEVIVIEDNRETVFGSSGEAPDSSVPLRS
ncbi:hypothetical protein O3P69_008087 [Scylla paramamosain]|uniref:Mitochondrial import inner membrane translocase subunit Tim21 n=1 Tax=Scylla paramamosain TaxID=85552 RepID=A0AAW0T0T2_SCYPA